MAMGQQVMSDQESPSSEAGIAQAGVLNDGAGTQQYLTFIMADEEYGVDILAVQEIRGWEPPTPIPNAPSHVRGVINLRGTIVPLTDLRQRFALEEVEYSAITVVIVLRVEDDDGGSRIMGIVVDAVSDVYNFAKTDMKDPPDFGQQVNTEFIKGLVTVDEKMIILLNINKLLSVNEIPNLKEVTEKILQGGET